MASSSGQGIEICDLEITSSIPPLPRGLRYNEGVVGDLSVAHKLRVLPLGKFSKKKKKKYLRDQIDVSLRNKTPSENMEDELDEGVVGDLSVAHKLRVLPLGKFSKKKKKKYLRHQIDVSLRNKTPSENMEDKLDNAGVEAKQLPEELLPEESEESEELLPEESEELLGAELLGAVRAWDIKTITKKMGMDHELMLTTCKWGSESYKGFPAVCTIFQLAVLLNSDEMVREMLLKFKVRFSAPQLKDLFEQRFKVYRSEISAWDTARVSGNLFILELFKVASEGKYMGQFSNGDYFEESNEKQDACDRLDVHNLLYPILDGQFEEVFKDNPKAMKWLQEKPTSSSFRLWTPWHPYRRHSVIEVITLFKVKFCWWGAQYGISLSRVENDQFIFHWIAGNIGIVMPEFLETICEALGRDHTTRLLTLRDHNGQTPMHILAAAQRDTLLWDRGLMEIFTRSVTKYFDPHSSSLNRSFARYYPSLLHVTDVAGRTCLHHAAANDNPDFVQAVAKIAGFEEIVNECGQAEHNRDVIFMDRPFTSRALELAVKHNRHDCVAMLVKHGSDINTYSYQEVTLRGPDRTEHTASVGAFQMAALAGHIKILKFLLKQPGLSQDDFDVPALHLAAIGGNPLAVKILLDSEKINPFTISEKYGTGLHFVAGWELEDLYMPCASDFITVEDYSDYMAKELKTPDANQKRRSLGGIIGCMDLLMQAGLDMEQEDRDGQTPQLISSASDELSRWWYDKLARQNQEAKTNLVAAANAVSVTAALVATASFVGPLTPPMGFYLSTDEWLTSYIQETHTAVRVFLCCNSLSFYFAIASIMLAVIPSLTIPHEGLRTEVRIANTVVQGAVFLLFLSIAFVICAFTAATTAVLPESHWHYKVLPVVSISVGILVCSIVFCISLRRLMRLAKLRAKLNAVWVRMRTNSVLARDTIAKWVRSLRQNDSGIDKEE